MDSTLLEHFVAVTEALNFTRAAKTLNTSRMTLISSVKKLEAELGYALFDRRAETTRLTKAGVALIADVRFDATKSATQARVQKAGGKAKASKGKGRAPAIKGQPRQGKRRQSR